MRSTLNLCLGTLVFAACVEPAEPTAPEVRLDGIRWSGNSTSGPGLQVEAASLRTISASEVRLKRVVIRDGTLTVRTATVILHVPEDRGIWSR